MQKCTVLNIFCVVVIRNGNLFWKHFVCVCLIKKFSNQSCYLVFLSQKTNNVFVTITHTCIYVQTLRAIVTTYYLSCTFVTLQLSWLKVELVTQYLHSVSFLQKTCTCLHFFLNYIFNNKNHTYIICSSLVILTTNSSSIIYV